MFCPSANRAMKDIPRHAYAAAAIYPRHSAPSSHNACHVFSRDTNDRARQRQKTRMLYTRQVRDDLKLWGQDADPTPRFPSTPGSYLEARLMNLTPPQAMLSAVAVPGGPRDDDGGRCFSSPGKPRLCDRDGRA